MGENVIESRKSDIVRVSLIGIFVNVGLSIIKVVLGLMSGSIAITMGGVNNITDTMSSLVTIVGTRLSGMSPNKKHPLGYGRIEYIVGIVVAVMVLYAGVTALIESVKEILNPTKPSYSTIILAIMLLAGVVKFILGSYTKKKGEDIGAGSLKTSGIESKMDAAVSFATVIAALIFINTGIILEAWLALVIAIQVIIAGIESVKEASSNIVGLRPEPELSKAVKADILAFDGVSGVYDLFITNYGPGIQVGSFHIEVPEDWTTGYLDEVQREISDMIHSKYGIYIEAIGIYTLNETCPESQKIKEKINEIASSVEYLMEVHGFKVNIEKKTIVFDIVLDFACKNKNELVEKMKRQIEEIYPDFNVKIILDIDISD